MILPHDLVASIESAAGAFPGKELVRAAESLSLAYRAGKAPRRLSPLDAAAYGAVRLPATWSAVVASLAALEERWPGILDSISSAIDVGTGPGTVAHALDWLSPRGREWEGLELDSSMAELARTLVSHLEGSTLRVHSGGMAHLERLAPAQLVTAAYCLNEMVPSAVDKAVAGMMAASRGLILVVEPGAPAGAATVARVRQTLLDGGWILLAPCPHQGPCPLDPKSAAPGSAHTWCHFSVRVSRTSLMRRLKGASAAFEDEPYCYVAARHPQFAELFPEAPACPDPVPGSARLLDSPRLTRAGAHYRVCSDGGEVLTRQVSGRDKEALRRIRRLDRGSLELPDESQMRD